MVTSGVNVHRSGTLQGALPFVTRVDIAVQSDRAVHIEPVVSKAPVTVTVPSSAPLPVGKQLAGAPLEATQLSRGKKMLDNLYVNRDRGRNVMPTRLDAPAWQTMPFDTSSATTSTTLDASQARAGSPLACWLQLAAGKLSTSASPRAKTPQAIEDLAVATNAAAPAVLRKLTSAPLMGQRQEPQASRAVTVVAAHHSSSSSSCTVICPNYLWIRLSFLCCPTY